MDATTANLDVAERVARLLASHGSPCLVIGAVALKLYAGGHASMCDIIELLRRNPEADIEKIRDTCRRYRLRGLDKLLEEMG